MKAFIVVSLPMKKSTDIQYPIHPLMQERKSIRAFATTPVEQDKLHSIFEAARWSFSSSNQQAWHFVYAHKNQPLWNDLFEALMDGNKLWNANTPVLILALANKNMSNDKPYFYNLHDVGAATMQMNLQAVNLGLQMHPMAGFDKIKAKELLNIPEHLEPVTMLALGYAGQDFTALNEFQQKNETTRGERFLQEEFVLNTKF
jgi:nitroreductase